MSDVQSLQLEGKDGLIDLLKTVVDPGKPGEAPYPVVTIVAMALWAILIRGGKDLAPGS